MNTNSVLPDFDLPKAFGFTMHGWDFTSAEVANAIQTHRLLNPAMELGTNICPWNCDFCFTETPDNREGRKHRLDHELSIDRRLALIDDAADLGARAINFVGAGEPTIDPDFWRLVDRMVLRNIVPIIYTEGSLKLTSKSFVQRLKDVDATVVLKVNSLWNSEFQDRVVRGTRPKVGVPSRSYFVGRNKALENLIDLGFNDTSRTTRLAFDTIICRENLDELEDLHVYARTRNIFILLVNYLPSGRTRDGHATAVTWEEQHRVFERLAAVDRETFGITHQIAFPYAGGVPCTIRGLGLYTKIEGDVFDCPGQSMSLGDLRKEPLAEIWQRARSITQSFDGMCFPRQQFWRRLALTAEERTSK